MILFLAFTRIFQESSFPRKAIFVVAREERRKGRLETRDAKEVQRVRRKRRTGMEELNGVSIDVEQLKKDWEENGFLLLRGIVSKTELQKLKERGEQMLDEFDPTKEMETEGLHIFSTKKVCLNI